MTDKLRGAFHGCPHHGDDYEACIQYSGSAPCDIGEERDRFSRLFANACETLGLVQEALGNGDETKMIGLEPELVRKLKDERDSLAAHVERLRSAIEPMIHSGAWVGDRKLVRNALHAIAEAPESSTTNREETPDTDEEAYWRRCAEDGDFSFWAEVEGAYRRACASTGHGSFRVDQWVTMARALKEAIERYHGRKDQLSPSEIEQLVRDIQELSR